MAKFWSIYVLILFAIFFALGFMRGEMQNNDYVIICKSDTLMAHNPDSICPNSCGLDRIGRHISLMEYVPVKCTVCFKN